MSATHSAGRTLAVLAAVVTVALTGAAFWLSYEHLHDVAAANGLDGARAWAWPGTVDLFIVSGEILMLRAALQRRVDWFAVVLAATGSLGSIALNVFGVGGGASALEYTTAAVPPSAALIAFGALMRQLHGALAPVPAVPEPAAEDVPAPEPETVPVPVSLTKAPPVPAAPARVRAPRTRRTGRTRTRAVPAPAAPGVPDPLVETARKSLGGTPSVRKLRHEYGIGQARAQRIRDELATAGVTP
ncbi:DUF2637 domain-containing protein [Streptomyces tendae]|uniref:DUF2637 domain-containing protein n=1 Tax=Streptomyces tendae TaxID=1932 RepID=UPI0036C6EDEF